MKYRITKNLCMEKKMVEKNIELIYTRVKLKTNEKYYQKLQESLKSWFLESTWDNFPTILYIIIIIQETDDTQFLLGLKTAMPNIFYV